MKKLNEDSRMRFYKKWAALRSEKEYLALDITSISSWSELIQYVEPGYNRDHEQLPQINLAMLFGEDSKLPVFSRVYPGSVKDVSTLLGLTSFFEEIKLEQMHFVMDKGFYSEKGIAPLLEKYIKFTISVPFSTKAAKELAEDCMDGICSSANAVMVGENIYYAQTYIRKRNNRRVYYHVYYDEERHYPGNRWGAMSAAVHLQKEAGAMVTYGDLFQFVIMLCAIITLVVDAMCKK